jgi:hypothetical protein
MVVGSLGIVVGVAILAAGGPGGVLRSPTVEVHADGVALVVERAEVLRHVSWSRSQLRELEATIELRASSAGDAVFVGVARATEVADHLAGAPIERVVELRLPGGLRTTPVPGSARPGAPSEQRFWLVSDEGPGERAVRWRVEPGNWWLLAMNPDGSPGLDLRASLALRVPLLGRLAIGYAAAGGIVAAAGLGVVVSAVRGRRAPPTTTGAVATAPPRPDRVS